MLNNDPDIAARPTPPHSGSSAPEERGSRWQLRNWRLRTKMAAVLLVPTVAALGVGGIRVYDGMATTSQLSTLVQEVELAQRAADLSHELQRERDFAVIRSASGDPQASAGYGAQADRVDQATRQLRAVEGEVQDFAPTVQGAYSNATNRVESLDSLRDTVNGGFTIAQTTTAYDSVLDNVLNIGQAVATTASDTEVTEAARSTEALGRAKEQLAQQRSLLLGASIRGVFQAGETDSIRAAKAQYEAALTEFETSATADELGLFAATVAGAEVDRTEQLEQDALIAAENGDSPDINAGEWNEQSSARTDLLREVEQQTLTSFHDQAQALTDSVRWAAIRDGAAVLVVLAAAFGVAAFIARSMLRPLRTLRYGALEIAQQSLPDSINKVNESPTNQGQVSVPPVPVHSHEEIGQVARSFDAVHQQALRLASEQALLRANINDLFVNLARRSQTLVQRQLSLIDRLEQDEQDPDQLSSLFELDHLATRMRRNNENLLILGGTDLTRRTMRPVPLNEVLGAAVSEVEQYTRISVSDSPELAIQGRIVNDFVHLTAELFENATVYSNPDTDVTVRTAYRRQQLVIEIRDRGVGIDPDDLEEINDRLTRPPEIDVAVSRRMGLFVVGQLALRHQIKVQLSNNDDLEGGVTATVYLSGEHVSQLTPEGPKPMPDMPRADQRDSLTETGSHLGLAAAFGHSGATSDEEPDSAGSAAKPPLLPPLSLDEPEPRTSDPAQSEPEVYPTAAAESAPSAADEAVPTNYSVRLTDSSAVEATEVPSWDESVDRLETPIAPAETPEAPAETRSAAESSAAPLWPSEDVSESFGGTCGVPSDASNDLFHSPFEAEKTTQFARTPDLAFPEDEEPTGSAVSDSPNQYGAAPENPSAGPATPEPAAPAAPAAPATGAAGASASTSSAGVSAGESWDIDDTPTQRLPIYEAVLSQWFRESDVDGQMVSAASNGANQSTDNQPARDQPVRDESTISQPDASQSASPAGDGAERAGRMASAMNQSAGARRQGPGADGAQSDAESEHAPDERAAPSNGSPLSDPPSAGAASGGMPDELGAYPNPPAGPAPAEPVERTESFPPETGLPARPDESAALDASHEPVGTPAGDSLDGHAAPQPDTAASSAESDVDPGWGSADAGWRAAEALLEDEQQQETTAAGLPKRVPKSNLVPGSVESRSKSGARPAPTTSSRSAEDVRGRMSNFQQGIRRGRHSKAEPVSSEPPSRHEEQE